VSGLGSCIKKRGTIGNGLRHSAGGSHEPYLPRLRGCVCHDSGLHDNRLPHEVVGPTATIQAIANVSGNNQAGKAGEPLEQPLGVQVTDVDGKGVGDVAVSFKVTQGAAGLYPKTLEPAGPERTASVRTTPNGLAYIGLTPLDVGAIAVSAEVAGSQASPVTFRATVSSVVIEFWSPKSYGNYASFVGPCRCAQGFNATTVTAGTVVEWKSGDDESYSVTATSAPPGGARFDSGALSGSSRFAFVPDVAGTWEYRDQFSGVTARLIAR
jgi:hypothetical protein